MKNKLLGIGILLMFLFLPMLSALQVENFNAIFGPVPIGATISYYPTFIPKITNNTSYSVTYQISFNTAESAGVNPASERTPHLREFKCSECGETSILDDRYGKACSICGSSEIVGKRVKEGNGKKIFFYGKTGGKKAFLYSINEDQKSMFKYIEPIPNTSFVRAKPSSQFTLGPYETKELTLYMEFPNDPIYFDKFYEVLISVYPIIEGDQYITFEETVTSEAHTEVQHHIFNLTIEGDSEETYRIISDETYPLVKTSNDLIDVLAVRTEVNNEWWELCPEYNLPFRFPYNRAFSTDILYKTKDINNIGETDVTITLRYKKIQPTVMSAITGRYWIKIVKDEEQNEAVKKSGKINIVDPSEMPETPPDTSTPFKTTPPPTNTNGSDWLLIGGVIFVVIILLLCVVLYLRH